jgi:hypothetical protein
VARGALPGVEVGQRRAGARLPAAGREVLRRQIAGDDLGAALRRPAGGRADKLVVDPRA